MEGMEGMTIDEMAKSLGLPYKTVAQRILRGGYEPVFSGNLYAPEVLEAIRSVPGRGRPPKARPERPADTGRNDQNKVKR
jgi:hypothetical protein